MMFGWWKRRAVRRRRVELGDRDCHCHVLPAVDDGSRSTDESLAMLRLLVQEGVRRVVATPHIRAGRFDNEIGDLHAALDRLEHARRGAGIDVELELGAEHYLDDTLLDRVRTGCIVAFGTERYVLFETSTSAHAPSNLLEVVHAMVDAAYVPLLAHVERYAYLRGEEGGELLEDLRAAGARFQVNRTVGRMNVPGEGTRGSFIADLLGRGWIDEVGSDLHRATRDGRPS